MLYAGVFFERLIAMEESEAASSTSASSDGRRG